MDASHLQSSSGFLSCPPVNRPGFPLLAWTLVVVVVVALFAPGSRAEIRIVATLPAIQSWAANVAGDDAVVEGLLPGDTGPHDFQFKPSHLRKLAAADVVLMNGLGVDPWLDRAIDRLGAQPSTAASRRRRVVVVTQGLEHELIRDLTRLQVDGKAGKEAKAGKEHDHGNHGDHGDHDHDHGAEANPHVWLDPLLARHCVSNLVEALCMADPAHAAGYRERGGRYGRELAAVDDEIRTSLRGLKDRKVVTFHDAFPYFCRRYDLELVGVIEEVPQVEPSPKYLARLSKVIRERKVRVLFSEPQFHPRLLRRLADDLGIGVAELDVLETGTPSPSFYTEGLRRNLRSLQSALR